MVHQSNRHLSRAKVISAHLWNARQIGTTVARNNRVNARHHCAHALMRCQRPSSRDLRLMHHRSNISRPDFAPSHAGVVSLVRQPHAASSMSRLAYPKRSRRCPASPIAFSDQMVTTTRSTHNLLQQYCCQKVGNQGEEKPGLGAGWMVRGARLVWTPRACYDHRRSCIFARCEASCEDERHTTCL